MLFLNVLVVVAMLCSYLSPFISPIRFWQFSFFGLVYPWLLLGNLLFIGYWIFLKKKWVWISIVCVLLGWGHIGSFVGLNFFWNKNEPVISISTYNSQNLMSVRRKKRPRIIKEKEGMELLQFLTSNFDIDVLCLQEAGKSTSTFIKEKLKIPYEYKIIKSGVVIYSKYQIVDQGVIDIENIQNKIIWIDIKVGVKKLRIYNLHLQSNRISSIADKVVEKGNLTTKETYKDVKSMMSLYRFTARKRAQQAEKIAAHIAASPYPVIVCGDFNDTPQSYTYRTIAKNLKDTFKEKGRGFGTTYAGNIPALHIDHILVDKKINVHSLEILKGNYSDHYPVISRISIE